MSDDEDTRQQEREARRRARMERMQDDDDNAGGDDDEDSRKKREEEEKRREEIAQERQRKQEERERRERKEQEEEAAARKKKSGPKKKGLGGLTPEKKKLLKQLIMTKAAEEMKEEARRRQEEKENTLKQRVGTISLDGLDDSGAKKLCKDLHEKIKKLEGEKYDWEVKIRNQDFDINELTIKVNDVKGKFVKPVLKKVNKTENKLARITKLGDKESMSFRGQLKSTGQNKFALEKDEGHSKTADWRENLKGSKEGEQPAEGEEQAAATA